MTTPTDVLATVEDRARLALGIIDGTVSDDDMARFADALGTTDPDDIDSEAWAYLHHTLDFTPEPGSNIVALIAWGGPYVSLCRERDGYVLTCYTPGHPGATLTSPTITAWGRMTDLQPL